MTRKRKVRQHRVTEVSKENNSGKGNPDVTEIPHRHAEARQRPPLLQVGLSIQVGRLYVTPTVWVWRVHEQEVCGNDFIANHLHKISHSHILPTPLQKLSLFPKIRHVRYIMFMNTQPWVAFASIFVKIINCYTGRVVVFCLCLCNQMEYWPTLYRKKTTAA